MFQLYRKSNFYFKANPAGRPRCPAGKRDGGEERHCPSVRLRL